MPGPGEGPFRGLCPLVSAFGFPEDKASARTKRGPGVPCSARRRCRSLPFSAAALFSAVDGWSKPKRSLATVSELPHSPATIGRLFFAAAIH